MTNHTPGTWKYRPTSGYDYGTTIYWIPGVCHNISKEEDARLIAAAPDLLAAVKDAILQIEYLHEKFSSTGSGQTVLARCRAAAIKATWVL